MKKLIIVVVVLSVNSFAFADMIDWDTIKSQTLKKNSEIITAKLRFDTARKEYNNSISKYFPKVSFVNNATKIMANVDRSKSSNLDLTHSSALNCLLPIFTGFNTYNDVKEKKSRLKLAKVTYERTVSNEIYNARVQYIKLMYAYESIKLLNEIKHRKINNRDIIKLKYKFGIADISLLKMADADIIRVEYDIKKTSRYIQTISELLFRIIGMDGPAMLLEPCECLVVPPLIPEPENDNFIATIPEFLLARYELEIHKFRKSQSESEWFPSINISGSVIYKGDRWFPKKQDSVIGMSLEFPIFTGFERSRDIKIRKNNLNIAKEKLKDISKLLKVQAVQHYNDLVDIYENIAVISNYLNAMKLQTEIISKKYITGLASYRDWYDAENCYMDCQIQLISSKKEVNLGIAKWYNFIGKSL
jgi:outer membrane protein TolC